MTEADARPRYGLDNAWQQARARLTALEEWLDPFTIRHLVSRGVAHGWRCLEVGAGGGSIAAWMCERVGETGDVLAIDIDTRFVEVFDASNLRVRQHDIAVDDLAEGGFDLAHCRLLLGHLPARKEALARMVAALRPGGWIVVEEMDFGSVAADVSRDRGNTFMDVVHASNEVLRGRGFDPEYGRKVLADLGGDLVDVETEGHARVWAGGTPGATAWRLTFEQLRLDMNTLGLDDGAIDTAIALCDDEDFSFMSQVTMAAWGRRV